MKKTLLVLFLLILVGITVSACNADNKPTEASGSSVNETSESSAATPTPTPVPTYAPGTELYGMLSVSGEVVIEPQYEYLDLFSDDGLARFEAHGLWGFLNAHGEEVIPAQYEDANNFSEGLAAVKVDGLWGFIDVNGELTIEPQFEGVEGGFEYGRCVFSGNSLKGIIDLTGNVILKPTYSAILITSSKYFVVSNSIGEYGIIDSDGEAVVECQYPEIISVTEAGCFFIRRLDALTSFIQFDMYDMSGKAYVGYSYFVDLLREQNFLVKYIEVSPDGEKWGLFDIHQGVYVIDPVYRHVFYDQGTRYALVYTDDETGVYDLTTGIITWDVDTNSLIGVEYDLIIYTEGGKTGVKKPDGTIVLTAKYDRVSCSPYGVYAVEMNGNYSLIDSNGNTLREFKDSIVYEYIQSIDCWQFIYKECSDEYSIDGFISRNGDEILDMICFPYDVNGKSLHTSQYPDPMDLSQSPAIVSIGFPETNTGGFGIINPLSQPIPTLYANYSWLPNQSVLVVTNQEGNCGLVSYDGTALFALQDCHIFTNSGLMVGQNDPYVYEYYNDTDFLIYTVMS